MDDMYNMSDVETQETKNLREVLNTLDARVSIHSVVEKFEEALEGLTVHTCFSCSGSGYYDSDDSPPCDSCDGSGKELDYDSENNINSLISKAYDIQIDLGSELSVMLDEKLNNLRK